MLSLQLPLHMYVFRPTIIGPTEILQVFMPGAVGAGITTRK